MGLVCYRSYMYGLLSHLLDGYLVIIFVILRDEMVYQGDVLNVIVELILGWLIKFIHYV